MADRIVCGRCAFAFPAAAGVWVACPRCGEQNVNPEALRHPAPRLTAAGCLGTLLVLGATFSSVVWTAAWLLEALYAREADVGGRLCAGLLAWGLVAVGGLLLIRAGEARPDRRLMAVGAASALLAALTLAAALGLIP